MNFNRNHNYQYFKLKQPNDWLCPTCEKGALIIDEKSIDVKETSQSIKWRDDDDWDPEYIQQNFIAKSSCNNKNCNETIFIIGHVRNNWEQINPREGHEIIEYYYPEYFNPPLNFFHIPYEIPSDVEEEIKNSFTLFWADKSACGNAIRKSVECICDDKKINKTKRTKKGKRMFRSLDERIKELGIKNPDAAVSLLAIKWLGNHGSHSNLEIEDIFDAYELLTHALDKLYINKEKRLKQLSKRIIKKKGPA